MHNIELIITLTGGLTAALFFGHLTYLLRLSPIVGYLIAGILLGPHTPGHVADQHVAEQFAEIGIILLMFGVGLHFHLEDLVSVSRVALPGAFLQSVVTSTAGALVAHLFGESWTSSMAFGMCLAIASTVVLTRVLIDNRQLHSPTGILSMGWLVVEDLLVVVVMVLFPSLFSKDGDGNIGFSIFAALFRIVALASGVMILGGRVLPWLLARAARSSARELFTLTVLVSVLGIAVGSTVFFNISMALGAFLAGMVVGRSEFSLRAASEVLPLRDAFSVLFFVSVGMLLDPHVFLEHPALLLSTVAVVVLGKPIVSFVILSVLRRPVKIALGTALALGQIGEFSFILGAVGRDLGLLKPFHMDCLVATSILAITFNPLLYRLVQPLESWISENPKLQKYFHLRIEKSLGDLLEPDRLGLNSSLGSHSVIVGFGPTGRTVRKLLLNYGVESAVVELNLETVRALRAEGISAIYGDASRFGTLEKAGVAEASTLILTSSSLESPTEVVQRAKELNPGIRIIARTSYLREMPAMQEAGCDKIFSDEGEVALALLEEIQKDLGASPEEISSQRLRLSQELSAARKPTLSQNP